MLPGQYNQLPLGNIASEQSILTVDNFIKHHKIYEQEQELPCSIIFVITRLAFYPGHPNAGTIAKI